MSSTHEPTAAKPDHLLNAMRQLRNAFGQYPTGVTVVTAAAQDGRKIGLTANSFASLSLDPPLVLWSIGKSSPSCPDFVNAGHFAITCSPKTRSNCPANFRSRRPTNTLAWHAAKASAAPWCWKAAAHTSSVVTWRSTKAATT